MVLNFKKEYSIKQLMLLFFYMGIFCLPIDSFPLFPTDNEYRPISFFFFMGAFFLYLMEGKINFHDIIVVVLCLFIVLHSLFSSFFILDQYSHLIKSFITLTIFIIISIVSFNCIQFGLEYNREEFLKNLSIVIVFSLLLIFFVGFFQILEIFRLIPRSISNFITFIFSYRTANRLQGVSGEPSWMVRYLSLFGIFTYYFYKGPLKTIILVLTGIYLLLSGSSYGYLVFLISIGVYLVIFKLSFKTFALSVLGMIFIFLTINWVVNTKSDNYTVQRLGKITVILKNPEALFLILESDGSMFQRIMNPVIGFQSGPDSYFLGLGLDGYRYIYSEKILKNYKYATNFETVNRAVKGQIYTTPKSLYSKFYAELGVVVFFLFLVFLFYLFVKIIKVKKINDQYFGFLSLFFSFSIISILNTDSIINHSFIFSMYFISLFSTHLQK